MHVCAQSHLLLWRETVQWYISGTFSHIFCETSVTKSLARMKIRTGNDVVWCASTCWHIFDSSFLVRYVIILDMMQPSEPLSCNYLQMFTCVFKWQNIIARQYIHRKCFLANTRMTPPVSTTRSSEGLSRRSEQQYHLKYSCYFGDWDSKTYSAVAHADPPVYADVNIVNVECCGHVQKPMGERLFTNVAELKSTQLNKAEVVIMGLEVSFYKEVHKESQWSLWWCNPR